MQALLTVIMVLASFKILWAILNWTRILRCVQVTLGLILEKNTQPQKEF